MCLISAWSLSGADAVATRGPSGSLSELSSRSSCWRSPDDAGPCLSARGLQGVRDVVVSGDGRNVYVAGDSSVGVFRRNPLTGALRRRSGRRGCLSQRQRLGCRRARGLRGADSVAISPDGRNVYVGGDGDSVVVLRRDSRTGDLSQLRGAAGCFSARARQRCASVRGIDGGESVTVSPDGANVYVASAVFDSEALATFARDPRTGSLSQLPGSAGCISEVRHTGCGLGRGLGNAASVTVTQDGRHAYVAARDDAVAVFARDPQRGALRQLDGPSGCVSRRPRPSCAIARGLTRAEDVVVSPDGRSVYVASLGDPGGPPQGAIAVFLRNLHTGELAQAPGPRGCLNRTGREGCSSVRGLQQSVEAVSVARNGRRVYVASGALDGLESGAVAVFARGLRSGLLRQLRGPAGCVTAERFPDCTRVRTLEGASGMALSPDAGNAYVVGGFEGTLNVFSIVP